MVSGASTVIIDRRIQSLVKAATPEILDLPHPNFAGQIMSDLDRAFPIIIDLEGGLVNNRADPGGLTKFGISKRSYPNVDIANLTPDQAKAIYQRDWWAPLRCDYLPWPINALLFESAINLGQSEAVKALQASAGVAADGVLGVGTISAISHGKIQDLVPRYLAKLGVHYASLGKPEFLEGWLFREFRAEEDALTGSAPPLS
jgi:lysozyme family protein